MVGILNICIVSTIDNIRELNINYVSIAGNFGEEFGLAD